MGPTTIKSLKNLAWSAVPCQANNCADKGPSVRRCYDPMICADVADTSPPVFLCKRCADNVLGERKAQLLPQVQPLPASSTTCGRQVRRERNIAVGRGKVGRIFKGPLLRVLYRQ